MEEKEQHSILRARQMAEFEEMTHSLEKFWLQKSVECKIQMEAHFKQELTEALLAQTVQHQKEVQEMADKIQALEDCFITVW